MSNPNDSKRHQLRAVGPVMLLAFLCVVAACESETQAPEPQSTDLITDFTEYCFREDVELSELVVSGTLVFDTLNLPSIAQGGSKLILGCDPDNPWGPSSALEFYFPEILGPEVDPGLYLERGWKIEFSGVAAEPCTTCYTNSGLAQVVYL